MSLYRYVIASLFRLQKLLDECLETGTRPSRKRTSERVTRTTRGRKPASESSEDSSSEEVHFRVSWLLFCFHKPLVHEIAPVASNCMTVEFGFAGYIRELP